MRDVARVDVVNASVARNVVAPEGSGSIISFLKTKMYRFLVQFSI